MKARAARMGWPRVLGCLAVMTAAAQAGWEAPLPADKTVAFAIPRTPTPPVLDGVIDPAEWRAAAAVSGIGGAGDNVLYVRPTTYFLAWDPDHLYLAIRVWVKPGYKPRVVGRAPGAAVVWEDSGEFHFKPMGKNVPAGRTDSSYKFMLNTLGYFGDLQRVAVGQQFKNWLPEFKSMTRLTPPGSAPLGGSWWECEVAMSTRDFELSGPNRAGDQWKLMLGFNHMYSGWSQGRIPATTSYFDPGGYPVGTLVENTPAVQATMEEIPGPSDGGVAAVRFQVFNPTAAPVPVNVLAEYVELAAKTDGGKTTTEALPLVKKEQALTVEPGKTAELKVSEKFPRAVGEKNKGLIFYRVTQGSQDLLRYSIYFSPVWPKDALAPAAPPSRAFALDGTFNPARSILLLTADAYYLDRPDSATQVTYRVVQAGSSRPVAEGSIDRAVTYYFRKLIELPPLAAGTYTVETLMRREDGKVLGPEKIEFVKADEARRFPEWWNTTVSDTERVIKPFTAMTVNGARVGVWGRTYTLNALGLPAETSSQGKPVSGGAARIVAVVGGKPVAIPIRGAPAFTEKKDWRVAFKGEARGAGLVFSAQGAVEQDGMALVDLTYAPEAGKAVTVDALRIEFPLANDQADCLLCQGAGGNYSSRTTMLLSPDTQGTLWTTLDTGRNGSGMTVGSFYPIVWVGNEQRGFMWCADNDKGWVPDNAVPAHDLVRAGKELVLRNHLIGKPFAVAAPRTVSFSYMASPFRPMVKGWRTAIYSEDGTFEGPNKEVRNEKGEKIVDGWCWLTPPSTNPAAWSGMWAGFKKTADARVRQIQPLDPALARNKYGSTVHTSLPLMGYGWKSPDSRVTDYFAADWAGDSWNKTEQDYFLYIADRAFGEGGLRTIYWDIFFVTHFDTLQNGLAYELPDGRIQPGFNTRNIRRFMMRMYALMEKHGLTPGSQVSHATNCYNLPASAWMDAILDGEYHSVTDESGMDWVDGYPIDRMRVMSVSGQFGPQISWMNLMAFKDKAKGALAYRGFVEYPRLYDTWRGPYGSMPPPVLDWGLNEEQVRYVPFWRNTAATSADASILVSMWQWPDRILLCVFNYDRKDVKDAVLRVDLDALDLVPRLPWQEFVGVRDLDKGDGEPASVLDFHGRMLKVPALKPHTGRLAGIRRY